VLLLYKQVHSHNICGTTTCNDNHIHHYGAVTETAPSGVPHTHKIKSVTTHNDGHEHHYCTETGPAKPVAGGKHYHEYHASTEKVDKHIHQLSGCTSID
jgi:hypothetical protein